MTNAGGLLVHSQKLPALGFRIPPLLVSISFSLSYWFLVFSVLSVVGPRKSPNRLLTAFAEHKRRCLVWCGHYKHRTRNFIVNGPWIFLTIHWTKLLQGLLVSAGLREMPYGGVNNEFTKENVPSTTCLQERQILSDTQRDRSTLIGLKNSTLWRPMNIRK